MMAKDQVYLYTNLLSNLAIKPHYIYVCMYIVKLQCFWYHAVGAFLYFYRPGDPVTPQGGGISIMLPDSIGQ